MKDKSWIIILIMGIALTISIAYSIIVSNRAENSGTSTVTTTSIIEMTASAVTIKNTLIGTGTLEYKEKIEELNTEDTIEEQNQLDENKIGDNTNKTEQDMVKTYQITLSIEDKNLDKAKIGQDVEVAVKDNETTLNYVGKVVKINKDANNKSTINIEILNPDEKIAENMEANCTVIIEKAENVVALPIEAIQEDDEHKKFVDVVQIDGTTVPIYIKTGLSDDYYVEITSGLNVGDRVQIIKSSTTIVNEKNNTTSKE